MSQMRKPQIRSKIQSNLYGNIQLIQMIIGTSLAALNNNGCGGLLGGLLGNNCQSNNLAWNNRVQSLEDDINMYSYIDGRLKELSDQNYNGRIADLNEKSKMYIDLITRDNAQNMAICDKFTAEREKDITEKANIYTALANRINELEKKEAANSAALPLMFELASVKANKYTDECCCKSEKELLLSNANIQRQLDTKINGTLKYAYSDLCAPVPSIAPLYCNPFTQYGLGNYMGTAAQNYNEINNARGCNSCVTQ